MSWSKMNRELVCEENFAKGEKKKKEKGGANSRQNDGDVKCKVRAKIEAGKKEKRNVAIYGLWFIIYDL